jgi:hypothetical protein
LLLGSVASRLLHMAARPVLIVPRSDAPGAPRGRPAVDARGAHARIGVSDSAEGGRTQDHEPSGPSAPTSRGVTKPVSRAAPGPS